MSACISCWICATIESVLDDMAMLLRHNRWVVLPIIAQSRRPFNATTFICRFRMRRHGLWSHSYQLARSPDGFYDGRPSLLYWSDTLWIDAAYRRRYMSQIRSANAFGDKPGMASP